MTAVANAAFTAAQFNAHVRDNLNETAVAKATTAGRWFVATGANSLAERAISAATVDTAETTASSSFADLTTDGPAVTVTTGTTALVSMSCQIANNTAGGVGVTGFAVSGASAVAASDTTGLNFESSAASDQARFGAFQLVTGLTAGSNTFKLRYRTLTGTGTFSRRQIGVMAL